MRCDVTWCDVMWRDVTWWKNGMFRDVMWWDGMFRDVMWWVIPWNRTDFFSVLWLSSAQLSRNVRLTLQKHVCVRVCVRGQPEGFRSEINVSTIRSWWGSSFPSSSFRLYHSIVLNSAQMSVLRAETSKIRGQKSPKSGFTGKITLY